MTIRWISALRSSILVLAILPRLFSQDAPSGGFSPPDVMVGLTANVSSTQFGAPLSMYAAVIPQNATGRITFYDGVTVLATKPLVGSTASFSTTLLPSGNHNLRAYYLGDRTYRPAPSNVFTVTVNALPSAGFARFPLPAATSSVGPIADFNGDGKVDLVTADANHQLSILLGDGTGNFPNSVRVGPPNLLDSVVVGDFNGDGIPDLALLIHSADLKLMILLGNGDGTFRPPSSFFLPASAVSLAVGDFNFDGIADLAVSDTVNGADILLGKGDGTFQAMASYLTNPQAGLTQASQAIVGDFNGDGRADLITSNAFVGGVVTVLLGMGDGRFQPPVVVATIPNASGFYLGLAVGDFNGDGITDVVTSNATVLIGRGDGTFLPPVVYPDGAVGAGNAPYSVLVADVNGDGKLDIALANPVGNVSNPASINLTILHGNGDGTFQSPVIQSIFGILSASIAADLNGDGRTDLVILRGNNVDVLLGTNIALTVTAGTPQSTTITKQFAVPLQVTFKDGVNPLAGFNVTFAAPTSGPTATFSSSTAVTDANGVASVTATANSLAGSYTVTASNTFTVQFSLTNLPATASVITPSPTAPQSTFLNQPFAIPLQVTVTDSSGLPSSGVTVTFAGPPTGASAVLSATSVVTNDLGIAVVAAAANNVAGSYQVTATAGTLSTNFALTNVQPVAAPLTLQSSSANPSAFGTPLTLSVMIANPNANGQVSLLDGPAIIATKTAQSGVATFSNLLLPAGVHQLKATYSDLANALVGTSNVITQTVRAVAGGVFTTLTPMSINPAPVAGTVVADFNNDGKVDFAFARFVNGVGGVVTVVLGKGDGTFQSPVDYLVGTNGAFFAATGDFNGDGILDLAVNSATASPISNSTSNYVSILLGKGDGTFRAAVNYRVVDGGISRTTLSVGDFNGDGKSDLLFGYVASINVGLVDVDGSDGQPQGGLQCPNCSSPRTSLLLGNGDGSFGPAAAYTALPTTSLLTSISVVTADFNGDGKLDVAISSGNAGPFIVIGNGDGTAKAPVSVSVPGFSVVSSLVSGDFNGDGKVDLAVGGLASNVPSTWILLGNGDGTFQPAVKYALGAAISSGDFNGDGITDLLVTDSSGNALAILLGKGDGTFQQGPGAAGGAPLGIADFNFDGRADVLTANTNAGIVTVLLGAPPVVTTHPPASIVASVGTPQSAVVGTAFILPLLVTVKDATGSPVSGATVTFTAPASGQSASLSSATALTNGSGTASVSATANNIPGNYSVTASVNGLSTTFALTNQVSLGSNLAFGKPASQSSDLPGYATAGAAGAVDGNTNGNFFNGSVTHTGVDTNAWWQVDLGASAAIESVAIWNRTDCCGDRLNDYWVFISDTPFGPNDTPGTLQNRAGTFSSRQTLAPNPMATISANGAQGRYVRVQLTGTNNLSLAEVQVVGVVPATTNLAAGGTASQSSSYQPSSGAALAIDGNTDGNFFDGSVSHTNFEANAWWQVDLGAVALVNSLRIWNRTDACCTARLSDYWVFVSNTPFGAQDTPATLQNRPGTLAIHQTTAPNPSAFITVAVPGRYVRVQLNGTDALNLAEVQVFGIRAGPPPPNLAMGKAASQSSTLPGYPTAAAQFAVDGNTGGNFFDGSVTHTNFETNPWWQVDLGASATVTGVVVWNRTDCCSDRLSDYWVFVSDTPFLAADTPATLQFRGGTFGSHQVVAPNPSTTISFSAQGRYIRVQLSGTNNLSLAEVQVIGTAGTPALNVAAGRPATQSSTLPDYPTTGAAVAVDGNTDGNFFDGSVTHTNFEANPWWQVDLGASKTVNSIVVWNRTDACCVARLSDYWVFVSDTPFLATDTPAALQLRPGTFSAHRTTAPTPSTTIDVGTTGRYVRVQLNGTNNLSLAEVQVFGQ